MTIAEQYFKDKIDWKIFNSILDACIDVEDANKWFKIQVGIFNDRKLSNKLDDYHYDDYDIVYTYIGAFYPIDSKGNITNILQEARGEYNELKYAGHGYLTAVDIAKMKYDKYGLFYILSIRDENIGLLKPMSKKLELFKERMGLFIYRKKEN